MIENWSDLVDLLPTFGTRLLVALFCGFLLGLERERKDKPAGLRTIVLITVGATLYMFVSSLIPFAGEWPDDVTRADPGRIASQVVSGIGFLGAGTIIQARGAVHGLTTAAVIWTAAAIGLCIGIGFPLLGIGCTLVVLIALLAMEPLRRLMGRQSPSHRVTLFVPDDTLTLQRVHFALDEQDVVTSGLTVTREADRIRVVFSFHGSGGAAARLLEALARIDGVRGAPYRGGSPDAPVVG